MNTVLDCDADGVFSCEEKRAFFKNMSSGSAERFSDTAMQKTWEKMETDTSESVNEGEVYKYMMIKAWADKKLEGAGPS